MPHLLPRWLLACGLLAVAPQVGRAGKVLSAATDPVASAPAAAPLSGSAGAPGLPSALVIPEPGVDAEPAPSVKDEDLKQTAEKEVEKHQEELKQLATEKTAESMQTINEKTARAKVESRELIGQEANKTRTEQAKEMDEIIHKQAGEMKKNRERIMEEAQETLNEVKDTAEIFATEAAKKAVDEVADENAKQIDAFEKQANKIKLEANKLADKAVKAAEVTLAAAKNASEWARKMPANQAAKSVEISKRSQAIAVALQNQARYVKRVAKMASQVADSAEKKAAEATKTAKVAKEIASEADEQAKQNAKVLAEINKITKLASKNAYDASMRSLQVVYAANAATKEAKENERTMAKENLTLFSSEDDEGTLALATKKRRMLKRKPLAATVLRSHLTTGAENPAYVPRHEDGVSGTADWGLEYGPPSQPKPKMKSAAREATAALCAAGVAAALFVAA